eukprot:11155594-Lingulodinium_polyedra.AAC.1
MRGGVPGRAAPPHRGGLGRRVAADLRHLARARYGGFRVEGVARPVGRRGRGRGVACTAPR